MEAAVKQVHLVSKNKLMEVKTEMKGTVKFFNASKGFGFIAADDGKEYFVHVSALPEGVTLNENDPVEFDVEEGDRGPKAVNVKLSE
jgi:CspA family cold shock protein